MESLEYVSCPISPMTNVDDDDAMWFFQDFLTKLAPLTTTNSFTGMNNYDSMPFSLQAPVEDDFYGSSISASESSPELLQLQQQIQQQQQQQQQTQQHARRTSVSKLPPLNTVHEDKELDLSVVNDKLEILKNDDNFTSRSLENIFDTKDILVEKTAPTSRYHHHHHNHSGANSTGNSISGPSANSPPAAKLTSQVPTRSNSIESTFSATSSQSSVCSNSSKQSPLVTVKMEQPDALMYQENSTPSTTPLNTPVPMGGKTSITNQQSSQQRSASASPTSTTASVALSAAMCMRRKRTPRKKLTDTQKQAHNKIEKKYRTNINAKIAGLQQIIPWVACEKTAFDAGTIKLEGTDDMGSSSAAKLNKSMILEKATDYILQLQSNEITLNQQIERLKEQVLSLGGSLE